MNFITPKKLQKIHYIDNQRLFQFWQTILRCSFLAFLILLLLCKGLTNSSNIRIWFVAKCYRSLEIIHSSNETSFENKIKLHCKKNFPVFGAEGSNPGIFGSKIGFCSEKLWEIPWFWEYSKLSRSTGVISQFFVVLPR